MNKNKKYVPTYIVVVLRFHNFFKKKKRKWKKQCYDNKKSCIILPPYTELLVHIAGDDEILHVH